MDYQIIHSKDIDNLNKDDSEVIFDYNPSTNVNFHNASIILNISLKVDLDGIDESQLTNIQKKNPCFDKFFIYKLFKTILYKKDNVDTYTNKRIYDYVRMKNCFNSPKNEIHGFGCIPLSSEVVDEYKLQFNIPLKYLFSEFEDLFFYSSNRHTLHIELADKNWIKEIFDNHDYSLKVSKKNIQSMYLKVPIKTTLLKNELPKISKQEFRKTQIGELNISSEFTESSLNIRADRNKPISFLFMLKDKNDRIITSKELANIQLEINNQTYPTYDMKLNNNYDYEYLYEMYCRYLDFYYGNSENYLCNPQPSYLTFSEWKKHPIICFILPQLKDDTSYEMGINIKFTNSTKNTKKVVWLYNYITNN